MNDFRRKGMPGCLQVWCSVALMAWSDRGRADEIASPANVNGSIDPRVIFNQTGSGGVPAYVWKIVGNEVDFTVRDGTAGLFPLKIAAGTPTDTLHLSSNGRVGFGTGSPEQRLHVASPDTPTLLLHQTTASMLPEQRWGISGNEGQFFIKNFTSGNIPVFIATSAAHTSLFVGSSGNVGLGTANPVTRLHAHQSSGTGTAETLARFDVSDDTIARLDINNATSTDGSFIPRIQGRSGSAVAALITEGLITNDTGGNPVIVYNAAKNTGGAVTTRPLVVFRNNNVALVTIAANGNVTATPFVTASSRDMKDKITELDSAKASAALRQLTPVEFVYKDDATGEPRVGFIAEDVPDLIAEPERKSVPVMDIVAVLTQVVKDQEQTIDEQQKSLHRQAELIDDQSKRLATLEEQVHKALSPR